MGVKLSESYVFLLYVEDGLTGSAWGDWANYTASPLRAFENELGVQVTWANCFEVFAPGTSWFLRPVWYDEGWLRRVEVPDRLAQDGDMEAFKRRRATELKNGPEAKLVRSSHSCRD